MQKEKGIVVITILIVSTVAGALIWLAVIDDPLNGPDGLLDIVYNEAPMLNELVENGTLPPVEDRLPTNPMLIQPEDEVGVYGGTWRMGRKGVGGISDMIRVYASYENLLRWDPTWSRIIPNLAQSYEVNNDSSEFTFHLREGLKWSDGVNFTADDILFWYEAELMNEELYSKWRTWAYYNDTPAVVEKLDDYTVKFSFSGSYGQFPINLAAVGADEITQRPKHYLEQYHIEYNPDGIDELINDTGASDWVELYKSRTPRNNPEKPTMDSWNLMDSYDSNSTYVLLERNPYYWKIDTSYNQLPYIDRINITIYPSSDALKDAFLEGKIDMQHKGINIAAAYDDFTANMDEGNYSLHTTLNPRYNGLTVHFNLDPDDPILKSVFSNRTFRIALSHAINRTAIVERVFGLDLEICQPAPREEAPFYREGLATQYLDFNLTLADELLNASGYDTFDSEGYRLTPSGHRINFTIAVRREANNNYLNCSKMLNQTWSELGLIVNIEEFGSVPWNSEVNVVASQEGYFALYLKGGDFIPSIRTLWGYSWAQWYQNNSLGNEPPDWAKNQMNLFEQMKGATDSDEMVSILNQIMTIAEEEFPLMGICRNRNGYALVRSNFHNVPQVMPKSYTYPTPAPTNPCQYYMDPQNPSTLLLSSQSAFETSSDIEPRFSVWDGCRFVTKER